MLDKYCDSEYCAEKALDIVRIENYNKAIDDACKELEKEELEEIQQKLLRLKKVI